MPQQSSWQLHTMKNIDGWGNEICVLSPVATDGRMTPVYRPSEGRLISEMDLNFDAEKMMFSMPDDDKLWQIYEVGVNGANLRRLSPADQLGVHNFDSCYLPNGKIAFVSTAPFQGVPCNASVNVGMTYLMDADGGNVRQLCFEQDHNFCPTVMNDGRILYLRWEYTDIPHVWARFLFTMNPHGTGQREYYGNVWEWTRSAYKPYPYDSGDGRNDVTDAGRKVVRGGSWYDRPKRCRSAFRLGYPAWRKVYNVGFRIVIESDSATRQFVKETPYSASD